MKFFRALGLKHVPNSLSNEIKLVSLVSLKGQKKTCKNDLHFLTLNILADRDSNLLALPQRTFVQQYPVLKPFGPESQQRIRILS